MEGQSGFDSVPNDDDHGYHASSGHVRIPYPSIGPLAPPPPPPVNFHPGIHLAPQHGVGVGSMNMNGLTMAGMNGAMPATPILTMPTPSVPNFYIPNNDPFSAGVVYQAPPPLPASQPVPLRIMTDPAVPFDPNTPPPFADRAQLLMPRRHGVLKIMNSFANGTRAHHVPCCPPQIPYTISVAEMQQFICKYIPSNHLIEPHVSGYPIHIIMERSTGKTMDCYVELTAPRTAEQDWEHGFGLKLMRIPKIGQRNVEVFLSNQGELMKDMFPRAKCIHFDSEQYGSPKLVPNRDIFSSGYKGFMTNEELTCMSQFANRSMQRTFESMISTLYKFPWFSVRLYTVRQVMAMFDAYKKQLDVLIVKVDSSRGIPREVGLDNKLLMDFVFAGLNAPGFSERQRADIVESSQALSCGFRISKHARYWPFQTLSVHPTHLSDQDIGMWFEILNIGMGVMESQTRKLIGIEPYLEVVRDSEGHILFMPTEVGLDLKRAQFSVLETRIMADMIKVGWNAYMGQMGVDPPTPVHQQYPGTGHFNNDFTVGAAHVDPVNPFTGTGSSNNGQESGSGVPTANSLSGQDQYSSDGWNADDVLYEEDGIEEGEYADNIDDPEQALKAMREVLRQVGEAPPSDQQVPMHRQGAYDAETQGLGAGLQNIELAGISNSNATNGPGPTIVGELPQQRTARSGTVLKQPFNPESPAFEPPAGWKQRHRHNPSNSDSTLGTGTVFGGAGLGNGDFTSPQRISTARNNNNKGKGKEPATTTTAGGGIRLQPAAAIFGPPLNVAFGRTDAAAEQPSLFQGPNNYRERRGVTIRSPDDGNFFATLQPTSALDASVANTNRADGIDEFLDGLFGETTTQAERAAMRSPVMTPTNSPTTARGSPLRRIMGRVPSAGIGPIEEDDEDDEVVSRSGVAAPHSSPNYTRYSDASSSPDMAVVRGPPEDRGPGSGWEGYSPVPQTDYSPKRGPRRLTTPGFGTHLVGSPYPQRITNSETTAVERSYRLHGQRLQLHIDETIDEEPES
ncbi:hypothetical protein AYO21_07887 [Fonsecaea monophora]|uniref:Uncharacterized protein n=1 Tax=Fonsecaea monophora TaxID=254056 RepID=A0A177F0W1_9EURO|nr:hypothetical protein AYO21_07887 [Fonsecaea monophora]OAG37915.1 hypothetical protein AYO21_07887 [Fonsecaea monophora]